MDVLAVQTLSPVPAMALGPALPDSAGAPEMLADVLRRASETPAPRRLVRVDRDGREVVLSYAEVRVVAERILGGLRARGARAGDEVILQLEAAEEFVPALWACILGGFTAVPVGVLGPHDGGGQAARRLRDAWTTLDGPRVIAGTGLARAVSAALGGGARVDRVAELAEHARDSAWHPSQPEDVAILLLTSGTTGRPRLIQRTHHNLVCVTMRNPGLAGFAEITFMGWLPLDHNAGLTGSIAIMAAGGDQVHLGIRDVLEAPERWLNALHRYRVTHAAGTNYALGLVNDLLAAGGGGAWDFSRIQSFVVGTEPVVARTVRAFLEHMAPYGFRPEALRPSYGMSEVGGITRLTGIRLDQDAGDAFVAAGTPFPGISLRVVDADGELVPEGREGRIQVRGDTVFPGYARDPEATRAAFTDDGWFDTGDNGFLRAGTLTVTGREKDVLIVNGLNIQAQEVEAALEEIQGVERGCAAVCAMRLPGRDTDQAAVFLHTPLDEAESRDALRREVRRVAASRFGAGVAHVILLGRDDIPRTDLGKIQRAALRRRLEAGDFAAAVAEDVDTGSGQPYTPPRTELQRELCGVWAAVAGGGVGGGAGGGAGGDRRRLPGAGRALAAGGAHRRANARPLRRRRAAADAL